ncbi:MAG: hypothetical protein K2I81_03640 [Alphaproteobacteria bacterium]|nr:hypothetical protein [Alphaproteobacteria bacterium]
MNSNQRGSIAINIILVLLLAVIAVLIFLLMSDGMPRYGRTIGTEAPVHDSQRPKQIPKAPQKSLTFDDGLGRATSSTEYPLDDFGAGLARVDVFRHDINNDGRPDRITRSRVENGTDHFTYEYKIELNTDNGYMDITPDDFKTVEGAQCALQKIRFVFTPSFGVIKISRPWQDTWITPTVATRDTFSIIKDTIYHIDSQTLKSVCDVAELF